MAWVIGSPTVTLATPGGLGSALSRCPCCGELALGPRASFTGCGDAVRETKARRLQPEPEVLLDGAREHRSLPLVSGGMHKSQARNSRYVPALVWEGSTITRSSHYVHKRQCPPMPALGSPAPLRVCARQ